MTRNLEEYFSKLEKELRVLPETKRKEIINQLRGDYGDTLPSEYYKLPNPKELAKEFLFDTPLPVASPMVRLVAGAIDASIILFLLFATVLTPLMYINDFTISAVLTVLGVILTMAVFFLYFPIVEGYKGTTLGKWILGLIVVKEDGSSLDYGSAFLRRIPLWFGFFIFDGITMFFFQKSQRAFDRVARTVVVKVDQVKKTPLLITSLLLVSIIILIPAMGVSNGFPVFQELSRWAENKIPATPSGDVSLEDIADEEMWDFLNNFGLELGESSYLNSTDGRVLAIEFIGSGYSVNFTAYKGNNPKGYVKGWSSVDNIRIMSVTNEINDTYSIKYRTNRYFKHGWARDSWGFSLETPRDFVSQDDFTDIVQWITLKLKGLN